MSEKILGIKVTTESKKEILQELEKDIKNNKRNILFNANPLIICNFYRDKKMVNEINKENLNIPDSNIQELRGKIKVNSAKNTEIIEISVTNKDPNKAAAIANEIAKPLRRNDSALAYLPTQFITEFIKSNGYAGVAYTSTMRTEGINVAVFDVSIFECVAVHTVEIKNTQSIPQI